MRCVYYHAEDPGAGAAGVCSATGHAGHGARRGAATTSPSARRSGSTSADFDVVLMRQDPPFDMAYITATHMLERIHPKTLVVNDPAEVRNAPEKLFVTRLPRADAADPDHRATARDRSLPRRARRHHPQAALRQWRRRRVPHQARATRISNSLLEMFSRPIREPLMVQQYLPEVRKGDKRIILVDGERCRRDQPRAGRRRGALQHACGRQARAHDADRARAAKSAPRIGPELKKRGLIFVGIDVIGDYLTEINVTSPTGIQRDQALRRRGHRAR